MNKTIKKLSIAFLSTLMLIGCSSKPDFKVSTSEEIVKVITEVSEAATYNRFYGLDVNGEAAIIYDPYPFVIDDSNRFYYASTGIRQYFEDTYQVTIDDMTYYGIEETITNDDLTVQYQMQIDELFRLLEEAGAPALSDEERQTIINDALAQAQTDIDERVKEEMMFNLEYANINPDELDMFVYSTSMMMTKAYTIGVFHVKDNANLQKYVDTCSTILENTRSSFEFYLADQYEIAKEAEVITLEDEGYVILVICEDSKTISDAIVNTIKSK